MNAWLQMFGVLGMIGGTIFSTVLSLTEGRRSFHQLSLPRFVVWGALGGLVLDEVARLRPAGDGTPSPPTGNQGSSLFVTR